MTRSPVRGISDGPFPHAVYTFRRSAEQVALPLAGVGVVASHHGIRTLHGSPMVVTTLCDTQCLLA